MDDALEALERAHRLDPSPATAAPLKAALLRLGRREELRARCREGFVCEQAWGRLRATPAVDVRSCGACARQVHLVSSAADVVRVLDAGGCAAAPPALFPAALDALVDAPDRGLSRGAGPCLVAGEEPRVLPWTGRAPGLRDALRWLLGGR